MKTIPFVTASVVTIVFLAAGAVAQPTEQTSPPAVVSPAAPMPAPDEVIYIPRLPSPAELTSAAEAQGLTIDKISQMTAQVTVVYRRADGQTNTVAYQLLPAAGSAPAAPAAAPTVVQGPPTGVVYAAPAAAPAVVQAPPTAVVYAAPAPGYYYDPYYWPWSWFAPVALDIGFDYSFGHYRGGGFRHGGGYGHGGFRGGHGHR